jgi:hypothetical protein
VIRHEDTRELRVFWPDVGPVEADEQREKRRQDAETERENRDLGHEPEAGGFEPEVFLEMGRRSSVEEENEVEEEEDHDSFSALELRRSSLADGGSLTLEGSAQKVTELVGTLRILEKELVDKEKKDANRRTPQKLAEEERNNGFTGSEGGIQEFTKNLMRIS